MVSKLLLLVSIHFYISINHFPRSSYAKEILNQRVDQISRLLQCPEKRLTEKVVRVTVLLPNDLPNSQGGNGVDEIWTKQNRLNLVLPGITLARPENNYTMTPHRKTFQDILPGWELKITAANTVCDSAFGPLEAVRLRCDTDVFLGPVCPYVLAPVARYSKIWKIPILTTSGLEDTFRDKNTYPIIGLSGTYEKFAKFAEKLLEKYNWKIITFLYEANDPKEGKGKSSCAFTLETVFETLVINNVSQASELKDKRIDKNTNLNETLRLVQTVSRVVIMCASPSKVREVLLAAEALGMMEKGEYVFFNVELFTSQSNLYRPWEIEGDTKEENNRAKKAYESVLTVTASSSRDSTNFSRFEKSVKELSKEKFNYTYDEPVNNFVANFHDAVLLYATALNETIEEDGLEAKTNGDKIIKKMWNRTIEGVTGDVTINENGDRSADYSLLDMDPKTGNFTTVAVYEGLTNEFRMVGREIHWPHRDSAPPDKPDCGFNNELCDNKNNIIYIVTSVVMTVLVLIFALLSFIIYRHYKLEADLANMTWKIAWEDLQSTKLGARGQFGSRYSLGRMSLAEMSQTSFESMGCAETKKQIFVKTCIYKGTIVAIKKLDKDKIDLNRKQLVELKRMKDVNSDHLVRFIGACIEPPNCCLITEYCPRGSLQDILEDEDITLEWNFRYSLVHDIVKAMHFLHISELKSHGNLKSSNCVVDSRFVLKVTDYSLRELRGNNEDLEDYYAYWKRKLWTAPELLRAECASGNSEKNGNTNLNLPSASSNSIMGIQKGDVYSFAIILHEIVMRQGPFYLGENLMMDPRDIVEGVRRCSRTPEVGLTASSGGGNGGILSTNVAGNTSGNGSGASSTLCAPHIASGSSGSSPRGVLRPLIDKDSADEEIINMMTKCWSEDPYDRPDFSALKVAIRKLNKDNESGNILDNLLSRMEQYANNLEALVEERTADYLEEKRKAEDLLYELLPKSVAGQLIQGQSVIAETFTSVTIYFSDIVGFTALSAESTPLEVVDFLNDLYTCFDSIIGNFDVYKIETIGDAYMVVSGLPVKNGENHAREIARMSLRLLEAVKTFRIRHRPNKKLQLRIGLHTGPCCAGVVGVKMPRYCLFGDTVNTASRMESTGQPLKIHVSPITKGVLDQFDTFILESRGESEVKGKGRMTTYWLLGEKEQVAPLSTIVGAQDDLNVPQNELQVDVPTSTCIADKQSQQFISQAPSVASEASKKAHFCETLSEIDDGNTDGNNRSSKINNPSELRSSELSSSHANQTAAHIFSNPMTSIIIVDDEDNVQQASTSPKSFTQPPPSLRNCVDFENETNLPTKSDSENSQSKNSNRQSTKTSSLAQVNTNHNEIAEGKGKVKVNSITNFDTAERENLGNYTSSGQQNMYEHNLGDKPNNILNSCIQSSETEPLVKVATTGNGATHPV